MIGNHYVFTKPAWKVDLGYIYIYIGPAFERLSKHDDVTTWEHFPRYWPFVRGIHRAPANSPHKGQCRWALMFSLICAWTNSWTNGDAGDFRRHRANYDVTLMIPVHLEPSLRKSFHTLKAQGDAYILTTVQMFSLRYGEHRDVRSCCTSSHPPGVTLLASIKRNSDMDK